MKSNRDQGRNPNKVEYTSDKLEVHGGTVARPQGKRDKQVIIT